MMITTITVIITILQGRNHQLEDSLLSINLQIVSQNKTYLTLMSSMKTIHKTKVGQTFTIVLDHQSN